MLISYDNKMRGPSNLYIKLKIAKRITPFSVRVNNALVKDKAVVLVLLGQLQFFQCLVSFKMIGISDGDGFGGFFLLQGVQDVFFHTVIV